MIAFCRLVHLKQLKIIHPAPEGGDVRSNGADIDTLRAEDDAVLTLVGRNLNSPVNDDIKALLINGLAVCLVVALT